MDLTPLMASRPDGLRRTVEIRQSERTAPDPLMRLTAPLLGFDAHRLFEAVRDKERVSLTLRLENNYKAEVFGVIVDARLDRNPRWNSDRVKLEVRLERPSDKARAAHPIPEEAFA